MYKQLKILILIFPFIMMSFQSSFAQSFGFGCFGFVGGYGGYSYQVYQPGYLNDQIKVFNLAYGDGTNQIISDYGTVAGYRLGINFFRANFSGFFVSLKGYYESLSENKSFTFTAANVETKSELDVNLKSWNVGIDFGIPITNFLSWKIVDGTLNFNSARLVHKPNLNDNTQDIKYTSNSPELGYSIATGFLISVIEDFVSIEGSAGYRHINIKTLANGNGSTFLLRPEGARNESEDFIKGGGFSAVLQLNVGFPL